MKSKSHLLRYLILCSVMVVSGAVVVLYSLTGLDSRIELALQKESRGDLIGANRLYTAVLEDSPDNLVALRGLAVNLMLLGKYEKALPLQLRVISLDPEDAQIRVELAFNYLNHQHDPQKGLEYMRQAATIDPSAKYLTFYAQFLRAAGDPIEATRILNEVTTRFPKYHYAQELYIRYDEN